MSKTSLSVIVPVYNAVKYLKECLDSILGQTYIPEKIILIDDGSTDGSGEICDQYSQEYANILVLHQMNQGVVASRKNGVKNADTEFVAFVDADDWINIDLFERMFLGVRYENADIVISGIIYEFGNCQRETVAGIPEGIYSRKEFHKWFLSSYIYDYQEQKYGILPSLGAKIFRTNILKQDFLGVDSRLTLGEDGAVVYPLLAKAEKISISSYCGYHYRHHEVSRMTKLNITDFWQVELLQKYIYRKFEEIGLLEAEKQQIDFYLLGCIKNLISKVYGIELSEGSILFPYFDIPVHSRIVIYGAGKVGMAYMREILLCKKYSIVLWTDQKQNSCIYGYEIVRPQEILGVKFDYILIAIEDKNVAEKVKSDLMNMGVLAKKIMWFPVQWRL